MTALAKANPIELADLEKYLFDRVGPHFAATGEISKEDFWLILIWKSNRSKNNTRRAMERNGATFGLAVDMLAKSIFFKDKHKDRLVELVIDRDLGLATSSAILTVFYPSDFTVYDTRVCNELNGYNYHELKNCGNPDSLWAGYEDFVKAVKEAEPAIMALRDKDKSLWGRSLLKGVTYELGKPAPKRLSHEFWNTKVKRLGPF